MTKKPELLLRLDFAVILLSNACGEQRCKELRIEVVSVLVAGQYVVEPVICRLERCIVLIEKLCCCAVCCVVILDLGNSCHDV